MGASDWGSGSEMGGAVKTKVKVTVTKNPTPRGGIKVVGAATREIAGAFRWQERVKHLQLESNLVGQSKLPAPSSVIVVLTCDYLESCSTLPT